MALVVMVCQWEMITRLAQNSLVSIPTNPDCPDLMNMEYTKLSRGPTIFSWLILLIFIDEL